MSGKLSADRRKRPAPVALAPSDGASDEGISAYRSRGVLFRIAPSLLPARAAIAWTRKLSEERPDLAARVGDATPLLSWQPSRDLVELLRALPAEGGDPLLFSESVGRAAASLTFLRLVGANPLKLTPEIFLDLLPALWRRYHTWGQVAFDVIGEHGVILHWSDSNVSNSAASPVSGFHPNGEPLLRGITRGLITRAAELAGFHHVQVEPPSGSDHRGPGVVYSLRMTWTAR